MAVMRKNFLTGIVFALGCALFYGCNPIFGKLGYSLGLSSVMILQCRYLFALLGMVVVFPFLDKKVFRASKAVIVRSFVIGTFILFPMNVLYVYSLKGIPASLMSLVTYLYPLFVLILSHFFLHTPVKRNQVVSVVLIILGGCCVFSDAFSIHVNLTLFVIALVAMLLYAIYLVAFDKLGHGLDPMQMTFWTILFSCLWFLILPNDQSFFHLDLPQLAVCAGYGLISTFLATVFLFLAIDKLGATETGIFCSFEPIFTIGLGALLLSEEITVVRIMGMCLLVGAIVLPNLKEILGNKAKAIRLNSPKKTLFKEL